MFKWLKRIFKPGPKEISRDEMLEEIDKFQERFDVDESELPDYMKNKDKSKWHKKTDSSKDPS